MFCCSLTKYKLSDSQSFFLIILLKGTLDLFSERETLKTMFLLPFNHPSLLVVETMGLSEFIIYHSQRQIYHKKWSYKYEAYEKHTRSRVCGLHGIFLNIVPTFKSHTLENCKVCVEYIIKTRLVKIWILSHDFCTDKAWSAIRIWIASPNHIVIKLTILKV